MILIDALFIANEGGGPNLLRYLVDTIKNSQLQSQFFLLVDERFQHDLSEFQHLRLKASLGGRYRFYRQNKKTYRKVFCFANTPPPLRLNVPVKTYFHNQMLIESSRHLTDRRYFRFFLRYLFVRLFNKNTSEYIVQTPHMVEEIVSSGLKKRERCKEYPFYDVKRIEGKDFDGRPAEFVYVSAASFYKNHLTLLKAWENLFDAGKKPVLHLTVSPANHTVCEQIEILRRKGLNIINHGYTDPARLYSSYAFMIYPSLNESFGLSLVEGVCAGMKVLAADLPYVRSVIKASHYFNPLSDVAIAHAVSNALEEDLPFPQVVVKDEVNNLVNYILN